MNIVLNEDSLFKGYKPHGSPQLPWHEMYVFHVRKSDFFTFSPRSNKRRDHIFNTYNVDTATGVE